MEGSFIIVSNHIKFGRLYFEHLTNYYIQVLITNAKVYTSKIYDPQSFDSALLVFIWPIFQVM